MKEKSTNKITNSTTDNDEMLEDYSTVLNNSHLQKAIRGKYSQE